MFGLGDSVPGYRRDDLNVFTLDEWERSKPDLAFEVWTARAKAARE